MPRTNEKGKAPVTGTRFLKSSGGTPEARVEAREKGLIRHIGFSVYNEKVALAKQRPLKG